MSHFYNGSSDYTNGGNGQKIFCMAYGTSAAICASFHKNWQWRPWWSVVTAKNTARPEQRERGMEGWRGSYASIALLAGEDSSLHSFCCYSYKDKEEERGKDRGGEKKGMEVDKEKISLRSGLFGQVWRVLQCVMSLWCIKMSPDDSFIADFFFLKSRWKGKRSVEIQNMKHALWGGKRCFTWANQAIRGAATMLFALNAAQLFCLNDCITPICRGGSGPRNTGEFLAPTVVMMLVAPGADSDLN